MKIRSILALLLCLALFLTACGHSTNATEPPPPHGPIPPQPIPFETIDAAVAFLRDPDYSGYSRESVDAYKQMVSRFLDYGSLPTASHSKATLHNDNGHIFLYPDVEFEDIGISTWFDFEGATYQVMLYYVRPGIEYSIDFRNEDIVDYLGLRMGISKDTKFQRITVYHPEISELILQNSTFPDQRIFATSMLNSTTYIRIAAVTDTSLEKLQDFIEGLHIDYLYLKDPDWQPPPPPYGTSDYSMFEDMVNRVIKNDPPADGGQWPYQYQTYAPIFRKVLEIGCPLVSPDQGFQSFSVQYHDFSTVDDYPGCALLALHYTVDGIDYAISYYAKSDERDRSNMTAVTTCNVSGRNIKLYQGRKPWLVGEFYTDDYMVEVKVRDYQSLRDIDFQQFNWITTQDATP